MSPVAQAGFLTKTKNAATVAGASRWRDEVAGSESAVYAPPLPGASAVSATAASSAAMPPHAVLQDRHARLVGDEERHRHEHARLVEDGRPGVDACEPGHPCHEHVPQGERVAGVQPAVHELVDGLEREVVERLQLADAGEMEERVAVQLPGDRPQRDAEADAGQSHADRERGRPAQRLPDGERERNRADAGVEDERPPQRPFDGEHHRRGRCQPREAPGERREDALLAERPCNERPGEKQAEGRRREPHVEPDTCLRKDVGERERGQRQELPRPAGGSGVAGQRGSSTSCSAEPDASHDAVSRYMRPALAAEQHAAQPQCPQHQPPGAFGLALAVVLREEAQVAADVLPEEPRRRAEAPLT